MDKDTVHYILKYYSYLLSSSSENDKLLFVKFWAEERNLILGDPKYEMISKKYEVDINKVEEFANKFTNFYPDLAQYLLEKFPDKIIINRCPKCNGLARTPQAKQCPHCFHSWHNQ